MTGYNSGSQTFLHGDPQLKYTIFCRPRGPCPNSTFTNTRKVCRNEFEYLLLEMYDKIIHNPKIWLELRGHSMTSIRPRDYFSTPWMVQLTPGGRYRPL